MKRFLTFLTLLLVLLGHSMLVKAQRGPIDLNLVIMNSMTRLEADGQERVVDIPETMELLVVLGLINLMTTGGVPLTGREYDCDVNFNVEVIDTVSDFTFALQQLVELDFEGIDVIIGPSRSSSCVPVSFVTSTSQIPMISPSCTTPELDDVKAHRFFARTIPSDNVAAKGIIELLHVITDTPRTPVGGFEATRTYSRVAVLYQEDTYGSNFKDALFENTDDIEFELIPFIPGNRESLSFAVEKAADTKLNVFVGILFDESFAELVEEAIERDMMGPDNFWIFSDGIASSTDMLGALQEKFEQLDFNGQKDIIKSINNSFLIQANGRPEVDSENFKRFEAELFKPEAGYDLEDLANVLRGLGETPAGIPEADYQIVIDLMENPNVAEFVTDFSLFAYDAILAIREVLDKNINCTNSVPSGSEFLTVLTEMTSFDGLTGIVEFDPVTGSRTTESSSFKLLNARYKIREEENLFVPVDIQIGTYSDNEWFLEVDDVRFAGDSLTAPVLTDPPSDVQKNQIDKAITAGIAILSSLELLVVVGMLAFIYFTSHKQVIKASQPEFLVLMLVGVVFSTVAVFVYPTEPLEAPGASPDNSTFECNFPFMLISFGITVSYASLVFKLQRVIKVANINPDLRDNVQSSMMGSMKYFLLVIAINLIVVFITFRVDPLKRFQKVLVADEFGQPEETYDICEPEGSGAIYALTFLFHIVLYLYGLKLILSVRGLSDDFQEGKWIIFSVVSQLQLFLLGVPIVIAVGEENYGVRYLVISLLAIFSNSILIALIFAPKVYKVMSGDDNVVWYKSDIKSGAPGGVQTDTRDSERMKSVRKSLFHTMGTNEFGFDDHNVSL